MLLAPDIASDVLAAARRGGADFAEIYAERWRRRNLRLADRAVMEATSGIEYGAGLRLFYGLDVVYAYTNELDASSLLGLCEKLCQLHGGAGRVDAAGAGGLDFRVRRASGLHAPTLPLGARDKAARLAWLNEADAGARVAPEIARVETRLTEWEQEMLVANSEGTWVEDERVWTRLHVTAIAESPGEMQTGSAAPGLATGLDLMERFPPREVGQEAGDQAMANLRGKPAPAGSMPVVIGNRFGGVIFHEALGHLLETTSVAKNSSVLSNKLGQQVASPCVTYIDDGTIPHAWGSTEFDDEGMATERTVLIRDGVLESYMVDKMGALKTGYRATGSGRRQNYTLAPTSRMRNTFIAAGDTPKEDLFAGIELGLYAKSMGGGQVRPGSGEYNFAVREGYMIRKGQIEEPVRGAMLVGKGPDSIMKIVAVSDDLENAPGMCGSLSGSIPVEVGQPHLLVSDIIVGGEAA